MLLIDAHEDLAWNMLTFDRDYSNSAARTREIESETPIPTLNGDTLLGLDDWRRGEVAIVFSTLFQSPKTRRSAGWDKLSYTDNQDAHTKALWQMDAYNKFCDENDSVHLIRSAADLDSVLESWTSDHPGLVGFVPLMEGADPIVVPEQAEEWFERGLRIIGLAWAETKYTGSAYDSGPLKPDGIKLLEVMADLGFILDLSHLSEKSYFESLDRYPGTIIASHANTRRFLSSERGLSEEQVSVLAERDGVIGVVSFNRFLLPGWKRGDSRELVTLETVARAIDHICQITGSANHVAIGTDFDGGFGVDSVPVGIDTIADLQKLIPILSDLGYDDDEIAAIFHGNWLRILKRGLPA